MTGSRTLNVLAMFSLSISSSALHAQSCPTTLTYSPANPVFGQPVTLTYTVQTTATITSTSNTQFQISYYAEEPVVPPVSFDIDLGLTGIVNTPDVVQFQTTPYGPGQLTLIVTAAAVGNYGETPVCPYVFSTPPLVITVAPSMASAANSRLSGQYAFLFQGLAPQLKNASNRLSAVGSFTADGQGNIIAGVEDVNSGSGSHTQVSITGTYSIDAAGHGILNLSSVNGSYALEFFVPSGQLSTGVTRSSLFSTDGYFVFGNGVLAKQTLPIPLAPGIAGSYALNLSGDLPCNSTCTTGEPIYESGLVSLDGQGNIAGDLLGSVGSKLFSDTSVTGKNDVPDPVTGRFTYSLGQGQYPSLNLVGYSIDGTRFFTMSTDSHTATYLLSGTAAQ